MRKKLIPSLDDGGQDEIDITPMLDVVFIMLIFFIVTATFVKESGIDVNRPDASTATVKTQTGIIVGVDASGDIWINKRKVELGQVRANIERLHAENPKGGLIVKADELSQTKVVVSVLDAAKAAGLKDIALATSSVD